MRQLFLLALLFISAFAVSIRAQDAARDAADEAKEPKGNTATALFGTPTIDGEIEDAWKDCPVVKVDKIVQSESTVTADKMATATVRLLWDADHLYALFEVKDSKLSDVGPAEHEVDSVELFVDELNQKAGTYQEDDVQYRVSYKGDLSGGEGYAEDKIEAVAKTTETGYLVEMAVKLAHAKRDEGAIMGLELQVNDGDNGRVAVAKFNSDQNDSYMSTSNFGNVILKKKADDIEVKEPAAP